MTLFHIIGIVVFVVFVLAVSAVSGFGKFTVASVSTVLVLITWSAIYACRRRNAYPKCGSPGCNAGEYRAIGFAKKLQIADSGVVFECEKCGR
jgi:hypothetical protein